MKVTTLFTLISRSRRRCLIFMPRSKRPEHTRRKAMRSRWAGSILAWILNTKPENARFVGRDDAQRRIARARRRRPVDQRVQDLAHAEVVDGRAEEHRRLRAVEEGAEIERVQRAAHQRDFVLQLFDLAREHLGQPRVGDAGDRLEFLVGAVLARSKQQDLVAQQVVHAAEGLAHADRPGHRRALDLEHGLHFFQQSHRIARFAVHLVHEREDRRVAHAAHVEQLDRLLFHALGRIDHHQRGIDRGKHAVGVFGKILVARACRAG